VPSTPTSPRLGYRPCTDGDVAQLHRHWNHADVRRHLWDDEAVPHDTVRAVIAGSTASFAADGYGLWILDDAAGFVGMCGLRATEDGQVEVLYSIEPDRWRIGLATEAAAAVLQHAFTQLGLPRVLGGVDTLNHASRRVLEKLGMTPLDAPVGAPPGVGCFAVSRARWLDAARVTSA
jgi:RimJ/RimL family protein N-acetyltransferase